MEGGAIADALIIDAPSSTKNGEKKRGPEIHATPEGNQWRFGMKDHLRVDAGTGYVHMSEAVRGNKMRRCPYVQAETSVSAPGDLTDQRRYGPVR